jgi:hypothetical protein
MSLNVGLKHETGRVTLTRTFFSQNDMKHPKMQINYVRVKMTENQKPTRVKLTPKKKKFYFFMKRAKIMLVSSGASGSI